MRISTEDLAAPAAIPRQGRTPPKEGPSAGRACCLNRPFAIDRELSANHRSLPTQPPHPSQQGHRPLSCYDTNPGFTTNREEPLICVDLQPMTYRLSTAYSCGEPHPPSGSARNYYGV